MITLKRLKLALKNKHKIAVGEKTLKGVKRRLEEISKTKVRISGRSYETGRKKTMDVSLANLFR